MEVQGGAGKDYVMIDEEQHGEVRDESSSQETALETEVAQWKDLIEDLPDLRLTKVMRLRRALASEDYDEDHALDRMLKNIQNELGVLCRTDTLE